MIWCIVELFSVEGFQTSEYGGLFLQKLFCVLGYNNWKIDSLLQRELLLLQ